MDVIDQQQEIADDILTKCGGMIHNMILAGGAPRDWYLDRPATDLDFYYYGHAIAQGKEPHTIIEELLGIKLEEKGAPKNPAPSCVEVTFTYTAASTAAGQWDCILNTNGLSSTPSLESDDDNEYYKTNPDVLSVYEGEYRGMKVQFMSCDDSPRHIVSRFPFNLCHIYWTLEDGLCPMEDFVYGVDNKVLIHEFHGYCNRESYTEKIKNKFPDWVYIDKRKQKEITDAF